MTKLFYVAVGAFLTAYSCSGGASLPECDIDFKSDHTWSAVGWSPYFDGYNNCHTPTEYGGRPVVVNQDGTWRFQ